MPVSAETATATRQLPYQVGVDIGGTFTDCVVVDTRIGEVVQVVKTPTTPEDQSGGFMRAVEATGIPLDQVELVLHGCTVGLNAILTRTGATTGLLTTAGFRDVTAMGRGQRPASDQFNPAWQREFGDAGQPFVPRHLRRPVRERIDSSGAIVVPIDEGALRNEIRFLVSQGVEAIAICFINAYANPEHEQRTKTIVAEVAPGLDVWTSTGVHPCFKEYPRFSTCVLNTYVGPLVNSYFARTEQLLEQGGYSNPLMIMQSNGGVLSADMARARPAYTLQSGPTAGVAAARHWAARLGIDNVLTLDIGGTSADYAVIAQGEPVMTTELELSHDVVVALPAVDLHSIGAGGGSIAWIDAIGALRVGPASAGSVPGPACYGRGGKEATVTDAIVASGLLPTEAFDGKSIGVQPELAREALAPVAQALEMSVEQAADSVVRIALANLAEAAREVSVYSGVDPRDFVLCVYGAAGPLFGSRLGRELGVRSVLVPPLAGTLSASGLAVSDVRLDLSAPLVQPLGDMEPAALEEVYAKLEREAAETMGDESVRTLRWLDGRYRGQTWETPSVPVPLGELGADSLGEIRRNFDATHERLWGYALPDYGVTAMMARITAFADRALSASGVRAPGDHPPAEPRTVEAWVAGAWAHIELIDRASLAAGDDVVGPAVILEETTTVVLMPGDRARVDESSALWVTWEEDGRV
jgi:N-methylhydantoinase A